ncbi:hypothetical protein [Nocardia grenadensis]|uniref:hypothetical protein n=1 Tax=Nocardia grenadensis TaxID=931537 RepID=UPI003D8C027D
MVSRETGPDPVLPGRARCFPSEVAWLKVYRQMLEARMDRRGEFLQGTEHKP